MHQCCNISAPSMGALRIHAELNVRVAQIFPYHSPLNGGFKHSCGSQCFSCTDIAISENSHGHADHSVTFAPIFAISEPRHGGFTLGALLWATTGAPSWVLNLAPLLHHSQYGDPLVGFSLGNATIRIVHRLLHPIQKNALFLSRVQNT